MTTPGKVFSIRICCK